MSDSLVRVALVLAANAIGLLVAAVVLDKMTIDVVPFVIALAIFTAVEIVAVPVLRSLADRYASTVSGLVALVATFVALLVTDILSDGLDIEGALTWVLATVIVWLVSLIGDQLLPRFVRRGGPAPQRS